MANNRTQVLCTKNKIMVGFDYNSAFGTVCQAIIYVQDSGGNFTIPLNLNAPLLSTNTGQNRFSFQLNSILNSSSILPVIDSPTADNYRILNNYIIPFRIKKVILGQESWSDTYYAVKAKIETDYWRFYKTQDFFFHEILGAKKSFLSNAPAIKLTSLKASEFLSFAFNINPCPSSVDIMIATKDLNDKSDVFVLDNFQAAFNRVVEINVSYQKIFDIVETELKNYQVFLTNHDTGELISEIRKYDIDITEYEDEEQLLFKNFFGMWDTVRLLANRNESKEVDQRLTFENENYQRFDYFQTSYNKFTLRTGPLERGFIKYIADELICSPEIYYKSQRLNCLSPSLEIYNPIAYTENAILEFRIAETDIFQ